MDVVVTVNGAGTNVAAVQSQNQPDPNLANNSASETLGIGSSGGNNGGIESDGSTASLIAQVNFERALNGAFGFYDRLTDLPSFSQYLQRNKTTQLSDYLPTQGPQNSSAVVTTPSHLIGITNAVEVLSLDYYPASIKRLGSILAMETRGEVYDHTKMICDRLNGASLTNTKAVQLREGTFLMSRLDHEDGSVDYAISFVAFKTGNGDFVIDSRWNQQDYAWVASSKVYNFQV
jgi:hypothetical protein